MKVFALECLLSSREKDKNIVTKYTRGKVGRSRSIGELKV
jgi:hypothetical protein